MIPLQLKLKNFLSYRAETTLDLAPIRIACLAGDNGAGKSALLDAMTWAIWGKTRASNDREVICIGETEMEVTFTFRLGERDYRIFRRRSFARGGSSGQHTLEFYIAAPGGEDWLPISGDNVRETQEGIVGVLNMDYETFVNSAFILQGKADSFTQKPPSERKKILGDILNLQEYDELARLARDEEKSVRSRLDHDRTRINVLDEQLSERRSLVTNLEIVSAQVTETSQKLDLAQDLAKSLALQLSAWERIRELLDGVRARAERERAALERLDRQLAEAEQQRVAINDLLVQAGEIEHGAAEHLRWRELAAAFSATLVKVQQQVEIRNNAEREIAAELGALQRGREGHVHAIRTAEQQLRGIEQDEARLVTLRREQADAIELLKQMPATRAKLEEFRHEKSTLHADNGLLKSQMHEIKERLAQLQAGDATCPVCRTPLAPADRERIHAEWTSEGTILGDRYRANKARMEEIDKALPILTEEEQRLIDADRQLAQLRGIITQIESGLTQREACLRQLDFASAEVERIDQQIATEAFAADARARLAAAQALLAELAYDANAHKEATANEQQFAPFEARKRELDTARTRLEGVERERASIAGQQAERREAIETAEQEIAGFEAQLSTDTDLRQRANDASDEVERLTRERNQHSGELAGIQRRLEHLDALQKERDDLDKETSALALDHGALRELIDAFGRNGIQAMIVENVLPELEDEANALLRRMASSQLHVTFRSQRQALSSDNVIETLDILIRDEYGERPYALYSGGEAFRVNFAVRVALSKLLARRAGANINMLVIDEGFGTQDTSGRDGLIEALHSVEQDFQTILVITHIGEIRELFPTRIDIVKTETGSKIAVNA
ncbi:MAG TPA: SMC family ATPase [Thermomicrobiales bacterium]|nr:SMC family ATPase [Thermomicrobiales bacterium]